jgi:hypothetical protein
MVPAWPPDARLYHLLAVVRLKGEDRELSHAAGGSGRTERDLFAGFCRSRHRLLPLLDSIGEVFEYAHWEWHWPKPAIGSFNDTRRVIEELDALDPDSFNFRYPTNIRGERAISPSHLIGQRTILKVLDDLAESLDTAVFGLDAECSRA